MASRSKPLDDMTNLLTNTVGALKGVGDEVKAVGRAQAERIIADMDLVTREDLDVLNARLDVQAEEIVALKAQLASPGTATKPKPKRKAATKKASTPKP